MASDDDPTLEKLWLGGRTGTLAPWSEAKAWAMRVVWKDAHKGSTHGLNTYVAGKLRKIGGGKPTPQALGRLYEKMDDDPHWYPGKVYGDVGGRPSALSETNKSIIARSLMSYAEKGGEATYPMALALCPQATRNPETGEPVGKKRIYDIMSTKCYDEDPDKPWVNAARLSRSILTDWEIETRLTWGRWMQGLRHSPHWYFWRLVWTDICNNILPRSFKKQVLQAQSRKAGKVWRSEGSQMKSRTLRGPKESTKQNSWDAVRVWWAPVLLRGKLHVEMLGEDFLGEVPEAMPAFVAKVRAAINIRCQGDDKPEVLFVDRGKGFYHASNGYITDEFKAALDTHNLKAFMRDDASRQPGSLWEMMLHETAVGWIRQRQKVTTPREAWTETVEQFGQRMREIVAYCNDHYDVEGLCKELPERLQELVDNKGCRLSK